MAEESFQEKTEQATPKRREEARKKGQVARSQELNSAVVLMAALLGIYAMGSMLFGDLASLMARTLGSSHTIDLSQAGFRTHMLGWARYFFGTIGPIGLVIGVAALSVSLGQVGFVVNEEALNLKFNRLDPLAGAKRILSKRSLFELAKNIVKVAVIGYVSYRSIAPEMQQISLLADADIGSTFRYIGYAVFKVGMWTALALLFLAIIDFIYQRFELNQSIRMTKQEVKEENKQTEGDPQVRMRIRSLQREAARRRMMDEVPEADVVITNPTHYAVALKYDIETMAAPAVVAKGQNLIAERIKQIARECGIPTVENKPLAQALFKAVGVGEGIPEDLYRAVAEVLAYVFRLKERQPA